MGKGFKFVVASCFLVAQLCAQTPDTVWAQPFNSYQGTLPATQLINVQGGNATHAIIGGIRNAPTHTCTTKTLTLSLQVSQDNTNWFVPNGGVNYSNSPALVVGNTYAFMKQSIIVGSYPYVRAFLNSFDTTNCVADVFYFGTKTTSLFAAINSNTGPFSFNTSGDHTIVNNLNTNAICVRGLILYNVTAAQTVKITDGPAGTTLFGPFTSLAANQLLVFPPITDQGSSYFCNGSTNNITLNLSANTEVDGYAYFVQ